MHCRLLTTGSLAYAVALFAVSCGSREPGRPATPAAAASRPGPGQILTLYPDGAVIRDRRMIELEAGRNTLVFDGVPAELVPDSSALVSLTSPDDLHVLEHTAVPDPPGPEGSAATQKLVWTVESARAGKELIELSYTSEDMAWRASYRLELDELPDDSSLFIAHLHGRLEIINLTSATFARATVRLADDRLRADPSAGGVLFDKIPPSEHELITLDRPMAIKPHSITARSLLGDRGRDVRVSLGFLYDPVGTILDSKGRRPVTDEGYGPILDSDDPAGDVRYVLEIPLGRATWAASLPPGEVVVRMGKDGVSTQGSPAFPAEEVADGYTFVDLGTFPTIRTSRWQEDFFYDVMAQRVVEEIRVELENLDASTKIIMVREHLYRGLNWTIAYHNDVGSPRKLGPQAIRFDVKLEPGQKALIMYRVVYTW